jgi:hypothetical protein
MDRIGRVEAWEFLQEEQLLERPPLRRWLHAPETMDPDSAVVEACFTYEGWAALKIMSAYQNNTMIF